MIVSCIRYLNIRKIQSNLSVLNSMETKQFYLLHKSGGQPTKFNIFLLFPLRVTVQFQITSPFGGLKVLSNFSVPPQGEGRWNTSTRVTLR